MQGFQKIEKTRGDLPRCFWQKSPVCKIPEHTALKPHVGGEPEVLISPRDPPDKGPPHSDEISQELNSSWSASAGKHEDSLL